MQEKMREIKAIEDEYGLMLFNMALTHLMDVGFRRLSDENNVEADINAIMAQQEIDKANGVNPILSAGFQCEIIRCAAELTNFSICTLFSYIKQSGYKK